jgi:hypothetical protein
MAWSKITNKCKKPWQWWLHKFLCDLGWMVRDLDSHHSYYYHLNMCLKYGFNLYGEPMEVKRNANMETTENETGEGLCSLLLVGGIIGAAIIILLVNACR